MEPDTMTIRPKQLTTPKHVIPSAAEGTAFRLSRMEQTEDPFAALAMTTSGVGFAVVATLSAFLTVGL